LEAERRSLLGRVQTFNAYVMALDRPTNQREWVARYRVMGTVRFVKATGQSGRLVGSAAHFEIGEKITTGHDGRLVISFPDGTWTSIGPDEEVIFDKFVYDPNPGLAESTKQHLARLFVTVRIGRVHEPPAGFTTNEFGDFVRLRDGDFGGLRG
jgi:hypothetical protein